MAKTPQDPIYKHHMGKPVPRHQHHMRCAAKHPALEVKVWPIPTYTLIPSHDRVGGPAAALGHRPAYVLQRVLYVAGLAVQAVLRVDLQPLAARVVRHILVHACDERV